MEYVLYLRAISSLMKKDTVIFDLIKDELHRQTNGIELEAKAKGTVLSCQFAGGDPNPRLNRNNAEENRR